MSLSFVSSAILSSSDGVSHNEETAVESKQVESLNARPSNYKPLFEQLRSNQQAEEEKREEIAKSLRGTRTLDDEDCAHLDAVEQVRAERDAVMRAQVEEEVAMFRAARADRRDFIQTEFMDDEGNNQKNNSLDDDEEENNDVKEENEKALPSPSSLVPKIKIIAKKKKEKRKSDNNNNNISHGSKSFSKNDINETTKTTKKPKILSTKNCPQNPLKGSDTCKDDDDDDSGVGGTALGGLLGAYDSESESN